MIWIVSTAKRVGSFVRFEVQHCLAIGFLHVTELLFVLLTHSQHVGLQGVLYALTRIIHPVLDLKEVLIIRPAGHGSNRLALIDLNDEC
ncbi:hypothetical protein [Roseibium sp. RKSG952]|uniref:hypothetical protein n=1 Tax=Roseibium sp. RKSG952 TaxID=2529384 RepID=UPI0012BBB19B|nr:hypothetical protein [Roseibium sp. RKSG952]